MDDFSTKSEHTKTLVTAVTDTAAWTGFDFVIHISAPAMWMSTEGSDRVLRWEVGMRKKTVSRPKSSMQSKLSYGWKPDLPDRRDLRYGAVRPIPAKLPDKVDLRPLCSRVENQGDLNSCTGNALAGALEFLENKDKLRCVNLSRLFIYYNERVMEHSVQSDDGAYIRDGIKTLVKQGVCHESKWPYTESKWKARPNTACYQQALQHQVTKYARLHTVDEMRTCLADGYPFVFGFSVYESFESQDVAKTGVLSMPGPHRASNRWPRCFVRGV